tara:strand:- start:1902 stop:2144 length:243 start_codon:yes stop_codon:yes gene_type:complete
MLMRLTCCAPLPMTSSRWPWPPTPHSLSENRPQLLIQTQRRTFPQTLRAVQPMLSIQRIAGPLRLSLTAGRRLIAIRLRL